MCCYVPTREEGGGRREEGGGRSEEGGGGRDGLWMCLCVVISDSMVFHCNFILGSVCHGSGRHHLSGPSDLSLICIGHRTVDAAIN